MVEEVAAVPIVASPVKKSPAKKAASKPKTAKPKIAKAAHPPASQMVLTAVKELKERKGSSLQAIKKFIAAKYLVDPKSQAPFIKKYLKSAVASGALVQTKGAGAAGSFKLPVSTKVVAEGKPKAQKPKAPKTKSKSSAAKKSPKKTVAPKTKKAIAPKAAKAAKPKTAAKKPVISKKTGKALTSKPKSPKPRKAPTSRGTPKK
ncbi:histone H1A, sperm-like [Belonocnema kinseyi]|uniref:histone H1A, sperm-like n=1 Tax=Belonocnema kinseyi TaxID=2817044 RepID=UPI00143DF4AA|nr:histone H1A, sperm-like [Belonocnema kinseyi]